MAEYYTNFSFLLPPIVGVATDEAKQKMLQWIAKIEAENDDDEAEGRAYSGIDIAIEEGDVPQVRVHSEGEGSTNDAADLIQDYLRYFNFEADERVKLTWPKTCSAPRFDKVGGGSAVVTSDERFVFGRYYLRRMGEPMAKPVSLHHGKPVSIRFQGKLIARVMIEEDRVDTTLYIDMANTNIAYDWSARAWHEIDRAQQGEDPSVPM